MSEVKRVDQAEKRKRILQVRDWLLSGCTSEDVVMKCGDLYKVKERQARKYISEANKLLDSVAIEDTAEAKKRHVEKLRFIQREAFSKSSYWTALEAVKAEGKALGVDGENEIIIKISPEVLTMMKVLNVTPEALNQAIYRMLEKRVQATTQ